MRVAVVGLGLIGGSVARRLAPEHRVTGWDPDPATRQLAAAAGLAPARSAAAAADGADVTIVATPLAAVPSVLTTLSTTDCPVVTDVGSVKAPALAAARAAGLADRYVGGHPMAGTEHAGFAASDPALLDGAAWVLCVEPDTDLAGWLRVAALVTGAGCRVVPVPAGAHDEALARVSGLPHLLATTLAVAGAAGGPLAAALAAGSFRDGTRVAGSRPELIAALCDGNREPLTEVLDGALATLAEARAALAGGGSVLPLATAGHTARTRWADRPPTVDSTLDPASGTFRRELVMLGIAGGAVHAVGTDGRLRCRVPVVSDRPAAGRSRP